MTGIAGWYATEPGFDPADDATSVISANLPPPGTPASVRGRKSGLVCRRDKNFASLNSRGDIHVAIEGSPIWISREFADMADDLGDAAALGSAYESLQIDLLGQLAGSFAFAIVDEKCDRVVLAIDRMGIRPMCYAQDTNGGIVFASTTNAVLAHGKTDRTLSSQSIYNYIYFHVVPSPSTIYAEISKLEPGQLIVFDGSAAEKQFYWTPEFHQDNDHSEDILQQLLMDSLRSSISRTRPDESTGAFLSGGLDSSTVCGLASELLSGPLDAYSIGFSQQGYDEVEYARIAAKRFGLKLHEYYVTPDDIAEAIPIIATQYDEPFGNSSAVPAFFCAKLAKEDGITRMLAGDGGDELFAGNERYETQRLFELYSKIPGGIRRSVLEPLIFNLPTGWSKFTRKLRRYVEQARVDMPERLQTYNYLHLNDPATVFDPDFLKEIDVGEPIGQMQGWYDRSAEFDITDRMLAFDWKLTLADNDVRKVNRMCEAVGVRVEYPLLDDDLVAFSTRIPAHLKLKKGKLRHFFKQSVGKLLPAEIIQKKKHGFGLPFGEWLLASDKLQDIVAEAISSLRRRRIFRSDFIDDLMRKHETEHAAYYGNVIWVLVMLEIWMQSQQIESKDDN